MRDADRHVEAILSRIRTEGCVLMLDFDGTLAPLVSDPRRARMGAQTHHALASVVQCYPTAVITGRTLADVRTRVPIRGISFAGNHGLEWSVRGKTHRVRIPRVLRRALGAIRTRLRSLGRRYQGIYIEDKTHTLSLHYRHVPRSKHVALRAEIKKAVKEVGDLRIVDGIYVCNVLPAVRHDKGTVARKILASLSGRGKPAPVFIGDDVTDEDAFRVFTKGITIKVGKSPSAARYYFTSRAGVDRFLRAVAKM
ncbi:trehalose-phosphatase [Candidatus Kaiserbacteria bacterium RIFCSPHIGHO2_02_FULL_54_11b]|uniref:Trehalose 6-phosphate phosphatase n=2 Tax=Candidatus Kaiseribacteriota TaxID=1752734 RepID=A0A1F6CM91_9BACT|nr:MAG: trehalose-phosphatase [Candidatus Kaiserbacteria bacterium RIFCSPHIGHO2_01_FULL_54_36b]OGG64758.1 MAG: trehalose-phosphatase [Candidatus Kaiserbacteria bacterium RIFCSPHIGHO2_02_FULL_54_11b]